MFDPHSFYIELKFDGTTVSLRILTWIEYEHLFLGHKGVNQRQTGRIPQAASLPFKPHWPG
jgi:hypothetical protein